MKLLFKSTEKDMTTSEILQLLVSLNHNISAIFAFAYKHPMLLQQRLTMSHDENAIVEKAKILRNASRLPFWESLMLSCFDEKRDYVHLLQEATFHQPHTNSFFRISRAEVHAGQLDQLMKDLLPGYHLSFSSRVELGCGEIRHIPLLDFHCPENINNDRLVSEVCKQLNLSRALVFASGESYHALGLELIDALGFRDFLTRSLLFAPIVDARYVAHQLLDGECALRLSHSTDKPNRPRLKFILE